MISSKNQTKSWRQSQNWYMGGKRNECEKFQKTLIKEITGYDLQNSNKRFNKETFELKENRYPLKKHDGLEWTENFDGEVIIKKHPIFFNLKFVCDKGGSQNRTISLVYELIKCQFEYIKNNTNTIFINILDGDTLYQSRKYFNYLQDKYDKKKNIFIGDSKEFSKWWLQFKKEISNTI